MKTKKQTLGYTRGSTEIADVNSEVSSDGFHVGLLALAKPLDPLPDLSLAFDLDYARFDNEAGRYVGVGSVNGDFDQNVWTTGLKLRYDIEAGPALITPFLGLRYLRLEQERVVEYGGLTRTVTNATERRNALRRAGGQAGQGIQGRRRRPDCLRHRFLAA